MITRQQVQAAFVSRREIGTDWQEGVISSVSPLRVAIGKHVVDATPSTLVTPSLLTVGMPVWCQHQPTSGSTGGRLLIIGIIGGAPFATLALSNLFQAGTPAQTPTAVRDGRWVSLEGAWQMAAGTTPVTPAVSYNAATVLFQLPAGWRPLEQRTFPAGAYGAAVQMTADLQVQTGGLVYAYVNNSGTGSTTAHFHLGAVRFRIQ